MSTIQGSPETSTSPILGSLIMTRGMTPFGRWLAIVVLVVLGLVCVAGVVGTGVATARGNYGAVVGLVVCAGMLWLCVLGVSGAFREVDFHEAGVVMRYFSRRREVLYEHVERMSYSITRQYVNGAYAGTIVNLQMRTGDGRKAGYAGRYNEKLVGAGLFKAGRFEGSDPMDVVRAVVSAHVAARMTDALARNQAVDWPRVGTISPTGLTPARGRRKGRLVGWGEMSGQSLDKGVLHLFAQGDKKSFLDVTAGAWNVYPAIEVIGGMIGGEQDTGVPITPDAAARKQDQGSD